MRYLDWDVLLFPSAGENTHVPAKEFETKCYLEQSQTPGGNPVPLLTSFIPSLPYGLPFQVSVHSWSAAANLNGDRPQELWQVKVIVDGRCMCVENYLIDTKWPQVIGKTFVTVALVRH